jgi:hypothetical protein
MRIPSSLTWLLIGALAGGLSCGPTLSARTAPAGVDRPAAAGDSPLGLPRSLRAPGFGAPLLIDRSDLRLGTTVQFARIPTIAELEDLRFVRGLLQVVITLDRWPEEYASLTALDHLPAEVALVVVLPGYPPDRASAEAWNLLSVPAHLIVVVQGPPAAGVVHDLNAMRALERLIVDTDDPSRSGFERLQRPLSFRVLKD